MKHQFVKLLSKGLAPPVFVLMCGLFSAGWAYASITPEGTVIDNTASVDYQDASSNTFTAISETATVLVGAVFAATIEDDELTVQGSPGNQTNIPFVLTNNANASDTFTLTVTNDNGVGTPEGDTVNGAGGSDIDAVTFSLFHDVDQSGTQNAGDLLISASGTPGNLTLPAGTVGALVLVVDIPTTAVNNDEIGFLISATSSNTTVDDLTASNGFDGLDETVQALVTVTANALLDINKTGSIDLANNRISYTLNVTNNGAANANDIRIVDMIPANTTFAEIEQINLSPIDDSFFDSAAGEFRAITVGQDSASAPFPIGGTVFLYDADAVADGVAETEIVPQLVTEGVGVDLNDDGTTGGTFMGLEFLRATLAPTSSVSISYTVDFDPSLAAGTNIVNTFCVEGDLDNDATADTEICSNLVNIPIPTIYAVSADDTMGDGTPDSTSLTDDEDGVDNDTQHESTAAAGETVEFTNVITNNGNAADSFDLSIGTDAANTFPAGTVFSFFLGGSPLSNNTGSIPAGGSVSITVQADLPSVITDGMATVGGTATVSFDEALNLFYIESGTDAGTCVGANDPDGDGCYDGASGADTTFDTADDEVFFAQLTAESAGDTGVPAASDTKNESLGAIREGVIDLANSTITIDVAVNADAPADLSDGIIDDGDGDDDRSLNQVAAGTDGGDAENDVISSISIAPGNTVTFPLFVANEQGSATSFTVSVDETITNIPSGWDVVFRPAGGGAAFTSTPTAVVEGAEFAFQAEITIPADGALAAAGDYDFAFMVVSNANSAITDTKIDRVTVTAICNINEGVGGSDQVQQLGTVDYAHRIVNDGNETQELSLSAVLSTIVTGPNLLAGWTATIRVDTDEDGVVDADYDLLVDGVDSISVADSAAVLSAVTLAAGGVFTLDPGSSLDFEIRVFAPSGADVNDQVRVTTTIAGGCEPAQIIDDTTIALQVRIDKVVAVDPGCTCEEDGAGVSAFLQDQTGINTVNPGQCLIWRLTVTNEGTDTANSVVISDQITPFSVAVAAGDFSATNPSGNTVAPPASTHYQVCADEFGAGSSCADSANLLDASATGEDLVNVSGSSITFNVGAGATNTAGGTLIGSNVAIGQFCVQVQ